LYNNNNNVNVNVNDDEEQIKYSLNEKKNIDSFLT